MEIALAGARLDSLESDYTVNLSFSKGWEVRIETRLLLRTSDASTVVDAGRDPNCNLDLLSALVGQTVDTAEVSQSGVLTLRFEGGTVVIVAPDEDYEAWTVAGPAGQKLVCQPGGEVAVWPANPGDKV